MKCEKQTNVCIFCRFYSEFAQALPAMSATFQNYGQGLASILPQFSMKKSENWNFALKFVFLTIKDGSKHLESIFRHNRMQPENYSNPAPCQMQFSKFNHY